MQGGRQLAAIWEEMGKVGTGSRAILVCRDEVLVLPTTAGNRKTQQLAVINIKAFNGLTKGEADNDFFFPKRRRRRAGKKKMREKEEEKISLILDLKFCSIIVRAVIALGSLCVRLDLL